MGLVVFHLDNCRSILSLLYLQTYCGFYKHQIEANLVGAETMFEAMGYKHVANGVLILEGPICPDRVSSISRDCLVAYVECQVSYNLFVYIRKTFRCTSSIR